MLILVLPLCELAFRIAGYRAFNNVGYSIVSKPSNSMLADTSLGLRLSPGSFSITINDSLHYTTDHSEQGIRIDPSKSFPDSLDKIYLFGCSFTYGMGVNNHEVMSSRLQNELKSYRIFNFGAPGYGNVQGFLQLKKLIENGQKPKFAVFNFADFHLDRNVLTPEYRQSLMLGYQQSAENLKLEMRTAKFPYAQLHDDKVVIKHAKWNELYENWMGRETFAIINFLQTRSNFGNRNSLELEKTSIKLFEEIKKLCDQNEIQLLVNGITKSDITTEFLAQLKSLNIETLDHGLDLLDTQYNNQPYDSHPNGRAHQILATRLSKKLKVLTQNINDN